MAIPDEDVAQVRAATDIVALIGEHAALKQQGQRWVGLCPFHSEKTPSFSVNGRDGLYYCFGCQASGDAITFVRAVDHLDFADAVRQLAERAGVTLHEDDRAGPDRKRRAELYEAMERAVAWYHDRLLSAPDAGAARDYLRSRGYDGAVVRRFRLGWAPDDWDALHRALGLSERVLTGTGLGFVNRRGRPQDSFRARVIFPICDPSGRPVALGGRVLPAPVPAPAGGGRGAAVEGPKYKNSSETAIYSKRRTLYALNWAKHDVVAKDEVVVCEGYTDVIGFFQAGVERAVATCGTALGEEHFTLLRNFSRRIVLAYDADTAGQSATSRVYTWERRHEVDVAVASLPPGTDPAELARRDPEALARAVAEARPFLQFRVDRVLEQADVSSVEGRARAADAALAVVAEHPDDLVRDQYVMQVADRCRLDPDRARERLEAARRRAARRGDSPARATNGTAGRGPAAGRSERHGDPGAADVDGPGPRGDGPGPRGDGDGDAPPDRGAPPGTGGNPGARRQSAAGRPGLEALRLAVHVPEQVADKLEEVLFADPLQRETFRALVESDSLHQALADAPPEAADLLRRLAVEEPLMADGAFGDPVEAVVTQLVRERTRRALADLQAAVRSSSADLAASAAEAARARLLLEALDDPATCRHAADQLVAWLVAREQQDQQAR